MSYAYRLRCRIDEEGFRNTVKYIIYVFCCSLRDFLQETLIDLRYSRRLLYGNKKTQYKHLGANDTYHTAYSAMPIIFKYVDVSREDVLVDVGCGKGRVINYWLSQGYSNKIIGLELDPEIAGQTSKQFSRRKNVKIISGDAISNLPDEGTLFYFYNPFTEEKVAQFEKRMAEIAEDRPVRIVYYNPKSIHVFDRSRWNIDFYNFERDLGIKRWGRLNKYHDLAVITKL